MRCGPRRVAGGIPSAEPQAGFALITVLWFLVLLAAVGSYMVLNARSQTALAHNTLASAHAEAVADAAVARTVFNLMETDDEKRWKLDGSLYQLVLPGGQATVQLHDERAKINPNLASDVLLTDLFEAMGLDAGEAGHLGASIADWVQKGDQPRPMGAKLPQYQEAGRRYGPPQAPVQSLDELELVLGMTPAKLEAMRPYFTLYTQEPIPTHLKIAAAPVTKAVEAASHNPATQSTGVVPGQQPAAPPAPGPGFPGVPGVAQPGAPGAAPPPDPVIATVDVTARSFDGGTFVRRAVVKLDFDDPKGYDILEWRRLSLTN